ncbi:hypothetical protein DL96DRAFT_1566535 [Flagelloscypha sp. PMI_526]|nr:hypothetical protein DL96DRAFT_1566535 [Flagelloscypha sp. PMI_526]
MFILSLFSVVVAGVAADCVYYAGWIRAIETGTGYELGKVAITLNDYGSFGLTNSSDPSLYAKFTGWNDCVNEYPLYLTIGNAVNPALQYASYTSEWTDCSQASLPGMLWFAPSNGGDIALQILTTLQHDWKTPTTFCGETMNWGVNMNTNWVNPDGHVELWSNFLTVYDSFEDRIIFVAHGKEYPSLIHEVTLDWV